MTGVQTCALPIFLKEVSLMSFDNIFLIDGFLIFFEGCATSNSKPSRILFFSRSDVTKRFWGVQILELVFFFLNAQESKLKWERKSEREEKAFSFGGKYQENFNSISQRKAMQLNLFLTKISP